jgi:hypothetical protein
MSFHTKAPKVDPPPPVPAPVINPTATPQTGRLRRLATGGRQSTFLGSIAQSSLTGPKPMLTGN